MTLPFLYPRRRHRQQDSGTRIPGASTCGWAHYPNEAHRSRHRLSTIGSGGYLQDDKPLSPASGKGKSAANLGMIWYPTNWVKGAMVREARPTNSPQNTVFGNSSSRDPPIHCA